MGRLLRLVESQEQKATVPLVDNLLEHDVLEEILEASKPPVGAGTERLDYLMRSPWRYPPLPWGSRFGSRFEPSLFYGALTLNALFAEAAYYRLVFLDGSKTTEPLRVISQHTLFQARYHTQHGMALTDAPFDAHEATLRHVSSYAPCQALGTALREAGVAAFTYWSARSRAREGNIALVAPEALRSNKHLHPEPVLCEARRERVQFRYRDTVIDFEAEQFEVNGALPLPA